MNTCGLAFAHFFVTEAFMVSILPSLFQQTCDHVINELFDLCKRVCTDLLTSSSCCAFGFPLLPRSNELDGGCPGCGCLPARKIWHAMPEPGKDTSLHSLKHQRTKEFQLPLQ